MFSRKRSVFQVRIMSAGESAGTNIILSVHHNRADLSPLCLEQAQQVRGRWAKRHDRVRAPTRWQAVKRGTERQLASAQTSVLGERHVHLERQEISGQGQPGWRALPSCCSDAPCSDGEPRRACKCYDDLRPKLQPPIFYCRFCKTSAGIRVHDSCCSQQTIASNGLALNT